MDTADALPNPLLSLKPYLLARTVHPATSETVNTVNHAGLFRDSPGSRSGLSSIPARISIGATSSSICIVLISMLLSYDYSTSLYLLSILKNDTCAFIIIIRFQADKPWIHLHFSY